jgi:hypothetical protein
LTIRAEGGAGRPVVPGEIIEVGADAVPDSAIARTEVPPEVPPEVIPPDVFVPGGDSTDAASRIPPGSGTADGLDVRTSSEVPLPTTATALDAELVDLALQLETLSQEVLATPSQPTLTREQNQTLVRVMGRFEALQGQAVALPLSDSERTASGDRMRSLALRSSTLQLVLEERALTAAGVSLPQPGLERRLVALEAGLTSTRRTPPPGIDADLFALGTAMKRRGITTDELRQYVLDGVMPESMQRSLERATGEADWVSVNAARGSLDLFASVLDLRIAQAERATPIDPARTTALTDMRSDIHAAKRDVVNHRAERRIAWANDQLRRAADLERRASSATSDADRTRLERRAAQARRWGMEGLQSEANHVERQISDRTERGATVPQWMRARGGTTYTSLARGHLSVADPPPPTASIEPGVTPAPPAHLTLAVSALERAEELDPSTLQDTGHVGLRVDVHSRLLTQYRGLAVATGYFAAGSRPAASPPPLATDMRSAELGEGNTTLRWADRLSGLYRARLDEEGTLQTDEWVELGRAEQLGLEITGERAQILLAESDSGRRAEGAGLETTALREELNGDGTAQHPSLADQEQRLATGVAELRESVSGADSELRPDLETMLRFQEADLERLRGRRRDLESALPTAEAAQREREAARDPLRSDADLLRRAVGAPIDVPALVTDIDGRHDRVIASYSGGVDRATRDGLPPPVIRGIEQELLGALWADARWQSDALQLTNTTTVEGRGARADVAFATLDRARTLRERSFPGDVSLMERELLSTASVSGFAAIRPTETLAALTRVDTLSRDNIRPTLAAEGPAGISRADALDSVLFDAYDQARMVTFGEGARLVANGALDPAMADTWVRSMRGAHGRLTPGGADATRSQATLDRVEAEYRSFADLLSARRRSIADGAEYGLAQMGNQVTSQVISFDSTTSPIINGLSCLTSFIWNDESNWQGMEGRVEAVAAEKMWSARSSAREAANDELWAMDAMAGAFETASPSGWRPDRRGELILSLMGASIAPGYTSPALRERLSGFMSRSDFGPGMPVPFGIPGLPVREPIDYVLGAPADASGRIAHSPLLYRRGDVFASYFRSGSPDARGFLYANRTPFVSSSLQSKIESETDQAREMGDYARTWAPVVMLGDGLLAFVVPGAALASVRTLATSVRGAQMLAALGTLSGGARLLNIVRGSAALGRAATVLAPGTQAARALFQGTSFLHRAGQMAVVFTGTTAANEGAAALFGPRSSVTQTVQVLSMFVNVGAAARVGRLSQLAMGAGFVTVQTGVSLGVQRLYPNDRHMQLLLNGMFNVLFPAATGAFFSRRAATTQARQLIQQHGLGTGLDARARVRLERDISSILADYTELPNFNTVEPHIFALPSDGNPMPAGSMYSRVHQLLTARGLTGDAAHGIAGQVVYQQRAAWAYTRAAREMGITELSSQTPLTEARSRQLVQRSAAALIEQGVPPRDAFLMAGAQVSQALGSVVHRRTERLAEGELAGDTVLAGHVAALRAANDEATAQQWLHGIGRPTDAQAHAALNAHFQRGRTDGDPVASARTLDSELEAAGVPAADRESLLHGAIQLRVQQDVDARLAQLGGEPTADTIFAAYRSAAEPYEAAGILPFDRRLSGGAADQLATQLAEARLGSLPDHLGVHRAYTSNTGFISVEGRARLDFETELAGLGYTRREAQALFDELHGQFLDPTTGGRPGSERVGEVDAIAAFLRDHPDMRGVAVELELQNLGGLNAMFGAEGANQVMSHQMQTIVRYLQAQGVDVSMFRNSGPRFSMTLVGDADPVRVRQALSDAQTELNTWAQTQQLRTVKGEMAAVSTAPHPRDASVVGPGFRFESAEIRPDSTGATVWRDVSAPFETRTGPETPPALTLPAVRPVDAPLLSVMERSGRPRFSDVTEARRQQFVNTMLVRGMTAERAGALFEAHGRPPVDALTGFEGPATRVDNAALAIEHSARTGDEAFYVEVDIRNLGGLNRALGNDGANAIFSGMSRSIEADLRALGVDVVAHRHGGDELSFVIVTPNPTRDASGRIITREQWRTLLTETLTRAERRVSDQIDSATYRDADGTVHRVADIPHTKPTGHAGTGVIIGFGALSTPDAMLATGHSRDFAGSTIETVGTLIELRKKNAGLPLDAEQLAPRPPVEPLRMSPPPLDMEAVARTHGPDTARIITELHSDSPALLAALVRAEANRGGTLDTVLAGIASGGLDGAGWRARARTLISEQAARIDPAGTLGFRALSGVDSELLLARTVPFTRDPPVLDTLRAMGLEPRYSLVIADTQMAVSEPFAFAGGRQAMIAYVEHNGQVIPRLLYRSNSQAVWRVTDGVRSFDGHIAKGLSESDTMMPIEASAAFHRLAAGELVPVQDPATRAPAENGPAQAMVAMRLVTQDHFAPTDGRTFVTEGVHYYTTEYAEGRTARTLGSADRSLATPGGAVVVPVPSTVRLPPDASLPDFSQPPSETFPIQMPALQRITGDGQLTGQVYLSRDGTLRYLLAEDSAGRISVIGVEPADGGLSSFGNRLEYVDDTGITAPLFEYGLQIPAEYGGSRSSAYQLNWNYVRELPIVQRIYSERGIAPPEPLAPRAPSDAPPPATTAALSGQPTHVREVLTTLLSRSDTFGLADATSARDRMLAFARDNGEAGSLLLVRLSETLGEEGVVRLMSDPRSSAWLSANADAMSPAAVRELRRLPLGERMAALEALATEPLAGPRTPLVPTDPATGVPVLNPAEVPLGESVIPPHLADMMEGSSAQVVSSRISVNGEQRDVVVKVFNSTDAERRAYINNEISGARTLHALGVGPEVHGMLTLPDGRVAMVMDRVEGLFPAMGVRASDSTVRQLAAAIRRINDAGYGIGDFQYLVSANGRIGIIDAGGMLPLTHPHAHRIDLLQETQSLRLGGLGEMQRALPLNLFRFELENGGPARPMLTDAQTSTLLRALDDQPPGTRVVLVRDTERGRQRIAFVENAADGSGWTWRVEEFQPDGTLRPVIAERFDEASTRLGTMMEPTNGSAIDLGALRATLPPPPPAQGRWAQGLETHRTGLNNLNRHLQDGDFSAVRLEQSGVQIPRPDGTVFNHRLEMESTRTAATRLARSLRGLEAGITRDPTATAAELAYLRVLIQRADNIVTATTQALRR